MRLGKLGVLGVRGIGEEMVFKIAKGHSGERKGTGGVSEEVKSL